MSAVEDALEALGHPHGALPEPRLLADLFVRFQAQVPLRRAQPDLGPAGILASWLEDGGGCCGGSRVRAFEALASAAGFALVPAAAQAGDGPVRRVLRADRGRLLLDAGFPLPAPLSLDPPAEGEGSGYGTLSVRPAGRDAAEVLLETRGEVRILFRVSPGEPVPSTGNTDEEPSPILFRLLEDRLLRWRGGVLEVSDSWSRLRLPFPASDADGLEALFGPRIPASGAAGSVKEPPSPPTLAVYHAAAADAARLRALLADPAVHAGLLPEGWSVERLAQREDGFDRTLVEEGAFLRTERITLLTDGIQVEAAGPLALFRRRDWKLEPRATGTRIRLQATLRDPVPPRGLPEGTRRRLVFELASELLALDGRAAEG